MFRNTLPRRDYPAHPGRTTRDLLNLNLDNTDLAEARERVRAYLRTFRETGLRITRNLDFDAAPPGAAGGDSP